MKAKRYPPWVEHPPLLAAAFCLSGCAGPHTPLGAVWTIEPQKPLAAGSLRDRAPASKPGAPTPAIRLSPRHQVLHGASNLKVRIHDPVGDLQNYQVSVAYNGYDVSKSFLRQATLQRLLNQRAVVFESASVRLPASSEHTIEFLYQNERGGSAYAQYAAPQCSAFISNSVTNTGDFRPGPDLLRLIERTTQKQGINPAFMTGLIAQESRFNPYVVSWAKAIGLTQITTSAEQEVANRHPAWPRYLAIEQMSPETLRLMIISNRITPENEWRLDPKKSVEGGVDYARILLERWSTPTLLNRVRQLYQDPDTALTRLILASYHSGFARVTAALDRYGIDWIKSPELKEARKYVNRIFSYCNSFSEPDQTPSIEEGTRHAQAS